MSVFVEYADTQDLKLKYQKKNGNLVIIGNVEECQKSFLTFICVKSVLSIFSSFMKPLKIWKL